MIKFQKVMTCTHTHTRKQNKAEIQKFPNKSAFLQNHSNVDTSFTNFNLSLLIFF